MSSYQICNDNDRVMFLIVNVITLGNNNNITRGETLSCYTNFCFTLYVSDTYQNIYREIYKQHSTKNHRKIVLYFVRCETSVILLLFFCFYVKYFTFFKKKQPLTKFRSDPASSRLGTKTLLRKYIFLCVSFEFFLFCFGRYTHTFISEVN